MVFWRSRSVRLSRSSISSSTGTKAMAPSEYDTNDGDPKTRTSTKAPTPQNAPLLTLPLELVQLVTSYLDRSSAASFCLSSRYICYAVGTEHLSKFLAAANSKFERRKNIEILERAFPSHWYCAWCDKFHRHDVQGGPKAFDKETKRDCAEFNSYLHDSWDYVLCYHHVRLAMSRKFWGSEYGIGLDAFAFEGDATRKIGIGKTKADTHLETEARIVSGHFLLHATYRLTTPLTSTSRSRGRGFEITLMPILPQIVIGHRDSHGPHTGLGGCINSALKKDRKSNVQLCCVCATDYTVSCTTRYDSQDEHAAPEARFVLEIEVWRDLGNGSNPFDTAWRAHGELGNGAEGFTGDLIRLTHMHAGEIKKAFESGNPMPKVAGSKDNGQETEVGSPDPSGVDDMMNRSWTQEIIDSRAMRVITANQGEVSQNMASNGDGQSLPWASGHCSAAEMARMIRLAS